MLDRSRQLFMGTLSSEHGMALLRSMDMKGQQAFLSSWDP